MKSTSKRP